MLPPQATMFWRAPLTNLTVTREALQRDGQPPEVRRAVEVVRSLAARIGQVGLGTLSSKLQKKKNLIQKHFRPKTLSSKTISSKREDNFIHDTFIQKHFHPKTLSSKNTFIQKRRQFHPRHFHPKTVSSNDTFIQKRFRPSKNGFVQ